MPYRIAVCDDNQTDLRYITAIVSDWAEAAQTAVQIQAFPSAEAFLFRYAEDKAFDILLLDIEMGEMDGVALAKEVRRENDAVQIVFLTGFSDFISEGYEVSALHYLMKPISSEKLAAVLDKAVAHLEKQEQSVIFTTQGNTVRLPVGDVMFVEAFAHSCTVTTTRGTFALRTGISEIEQMLGEGFTRCHRSYLVGIRHIRTIGKEAVTLDNGKQIPLSRRRYDAVNQAFIRYFMGG